MSGYKIPVGKLVEQSYGRSFVTARYAAKLVFHGRNSWHADDPIGVSRLLRDYIQGSPA